MTHVDRSLVQRKLGFIETSMALMHQYGNGTTQGVISVQVDFKIDAERFNIAVAKVHRAFAILRCTLIEAEDGLYFYENVAVENCLLDPVHTANHREWISIEDTLVHDPIDRNRRLWSAGLIYSQDLACSKILLVSHHALFDAQGAVTVFNALLTYLDNPDAVIDLPDSLTISPPLDQFLMEPTAIASPQPTEVSPVPYHQNSALSDRRTCYYRVKLARESIEEIEAYSAAESISAQALISAAYVLAILEVDQSAPQVDFKTAVALRELIADAGDLKDAISCYIGISESHVTRNTTTLGDIARSIQAQNLNFVIERCLYRVPFTVSGLTSRIQALSENSHFIGYALTHIGRLQINPTCGGIALGELTILTNRVIGNYAITLQILEQESFTTFDFIYVSPLLSPQRVREIAQAFRQIIGNLNAIRHAVPN